MQDGASIGLKKKFCAAPKTVDSIRQYL